MAVLNELDGKEEEIDDITLNVNVNAMQLTVGRPFTIVICRSHVSPVI